MQKKNKDNNKIKKSKLGLMAASGALLIGALFAIPASHHAAFATTTITTQEDNSTALIDAGQDVTKSQDDFKNFFRDYSNDNFHSKDSNDNGGNTVVIIKNPGFEHSNHVLNEILQNTEDTTTQLKEIDKDTDHIEKTTDNTQQLVDDRTTMLSKQINELKDSAGIDKTRYNMLIQQLNNIRHTNASDHEELLKQIDDLKEQVQQSQKDLQKAISDSNKSIKNKVEDSEGDTVKKINAHTDDAFANFKQWFLDLMNAAVAYISQHMDSSSSNTNSSK